MKPLRESREKVHGAVLRNLAAGFEHDLNPGSYGAMASADMAQDLVDEVLDEHAALLMDDALGRQRVADLLTPAALIGLHEWLEDQIDYRITRAATECSDDEGKGSN